MIKDLVKKTLLHLGYEVRRVREMGQDPLSDMRKMCAGLSRPVIFDVGANRGQSIERFLRVFHEPVIHAFEPAKEPYEELVARFSQVPDLVLNPLAVGAASGSGVLNENIYTDMSSFLELGPESAGRVKERHDVSLVTLDDYCETREIEAIDILKIDTEGFDFEVIKGGIGLYRRRAVKLLFFEIIFSEVYKGIPPFDEILRFLAAQRFELVCLYEFHFNLGRACYANALFVHPEYRRPSG